MEEQLALDRSAMESLLSPEREAVLSLSHRPAHSIVHGESPRIQYRREVYSHQDRIAVHYGQLKLGVCLVRFLADYGHLARTVVYAGAAPGTNITQVARLFPDHEFHLYDPASFKLFAQGIKDVRDEPVTERLHIIQGFFTDECAKQWKNSEILFVSDIRTSESGDIPLDVDIMRDLETQLKWWRILGTAAKVSMLKFRLPFETPESVEYPEGKIWIQSWAPPTSTETRLVLRPNASLITYDTRCYEEELFYHNIIRREWWFWDKSNLKFFERCYDYCAARRVFISAFGMDRADSILMTFLTALRVDLGFHENRFRTIMTTRLMTLRPAFSRKRPHRSAFEEK